MFDADTRSMTQDQSHATRPVLDLGFLLDTFDATEDYWQELPAPCPLFIEEVRRALCEAVEVDNGT
jgi:hypothetical protein